MLEIPRTDTVPVYRVENLNIPGTPNGVTSHEDLVGQWFSPNVDTALGHLRKSTQTFGRDAAPVDGVQLVVAHVPADQLDSMHASHHPTAASMDFENDNYIVPRDGSVLTNVIPLDETIGDLRGQLGNLNKYRQARQRVHALLGELAVEPEEIVLKDRVLYHGSATSDIELFNPAEEDTVGKGIYFVDNPEDAAGYARLRARRDGNPPIVYEAEIEKAKLVNLDNPGKLTEVMQGFATELRKLDLSKMPWYSQGAVLRVLETIDQGVKPGAVKQATQTLGERFSEYLKGRGYDGLKTAEGGEGQEVGNHSTYLIFDAEKVKIKNQVAPEV